MPDDQWMVEWGHKETSAIGASIRQKRFVELFVDGSGRSDAVRAYHAGWTKSEMGTVLHLKGTRQ